MGAMASPLTGAAGNVEFLVHARKGARRAPTRVRPPPCSPPPWRRRRATCRPAPTAAG